MPMVRVVEGCFPSLIFCSLPVRKLMIHRQRGSDTVSWEILVWRSSDTIVVILELKSVYRIRALDPQLSRG